MYIKEFLKILDRLSADEKRECLDEISQLLRAGSKESRRGSQGSPQEP